MSKKYHVFSRAILMLALLFGALLASPVFAATQTVKIAFIDPLSGPFGPVGTLNAQLTQFMFNRVNNSGELKGYKLKLVPFDDKVDPQTALVDARKAADQGIRYILQGDGSNVAFALVDWIKKYNRDNPDHKMVYLNYAAVDPGLSNEDCGFYHFNLDANVNMKVAGLVTYLKDKKDVHKVFLQNMDYSFGHAVSQSARQMIKRARPDIKIVGDVFTPIGQTKDFTPYINKIKQSGADVVVTGNWGADMTLLIKAAGQAGLQGVKFLTFYGGIPGTPQAMGDAAAGRVTQFTPWVDGEGGSQMAEMAKEFKKAYHNDFYYGTNLYVAKLLSQAINQAGSADPTKVALALEGMHYDGPMGDVYVRADNHAIVMPLYVSTLTKGTKPALKGMNSNFKVDKRIEAISTMLPTSCQMNRPKGMMSPNAFYNNVGK